MNLLALTFGLTGGIATGKSTVARMMVQRGAVLIDADQVAREVVQPGTPGLARLVERFGRHILTPEGALDRKRLAAIVFADAQALGELNRITHPLIRMRMQELASIAYKTCPQAVVVMDIPLLIEGMVRENYRPVDWVILVYVPREVQLQRLMKRDGLEPSAAEQRLRAQMSIEEKRNYADEVIDNSSSLADTEKQVEELMDRLRQKVLGERP